MSWYSALNVEVMATSRYFLFSLLACLYCLPWYPVLWCRWLAEEFLRSAHSSGSLDVFPPWILIHVSNSDWCTNGPFSIPKLDPYALFYVQILPSHTHTNQANSSWWKNTCLYRIQNIRSGKLTDLLYSQLITCTM